MCALNILHKNLRHINKILKVNYLLSQNIQLQSNYEKNIRKTQTEGHSMKYLMRTPFFFFSISFHSILFYVGFRYIAQWLDNQILYKFPDTSSTHLAPYIIITILLTKFPVLYFTSPCQYGLLNPFTFFTWSPNSPPLQQPSVCSLYL